MEKENWLDALNDEVRDIRELTIQVRKETEEVRKSTEAIKEETKETRRKADAAWELVVMTREQMKEELAYLMKPLWKKWFGLN